MISFRMMKAIAILLVVTASVCLADDSAQWERFKGIFVSKDGRVTDYSNGLISSSEGQGYAMLVAVDRDDAPVFDLIWKWTKNNLQVRKEDKLFAWKWGERISGRWEVIDLNNASDGDTAIALALIGAADRWNRADYRRDALEIIRSIQDKLVIEKWGKLFVLPAYFGFIEGENLILNPSYFIFSAYKEFASYSEESFWQSVYRDSLNILTLSTFGNLRLPADWIVWKMSGPEILTGKSEFFGYEAIRTLLYLSWDDNIQALPQIQEYLDLIDRLGFIPCCINLHRNSLSLDDASGGYYAVLARAAEEYGKKEQSKKLWRKAGEKIVNENRDYYSSILYLLSRIQFGQ